jgi:hypothetical protein
MAQRSSIFTSSSDSHTLNSRADPCPEERPSEPRSTSRAEPAPQSQHQVQRVSSLESIFFCCLVVGPVARYVSHVQLVAPYLIHSTYTSHILQPGQPRADLHLFSSVNQPLLHRRDALLLFHALLDLRHLVVRLDVELDFAAGESADPV